MSKRNLFPELSVSLSEAKKHSEEKLTVKVVQVEGKEDFIILLPRAVALRNTG